jgi:hypothetical protein
MPGKAALLNASPAIFKLQKESKMIKGALILATGFALGYAKAMQENEELRESFGQFVADMRSLAQEAQDRRKAETAAETEEKDPPEAEVVNADNSGEDHTDGTD